MYKNLFESAGLTPEEAQVYELLLQYGPQGVADLLKRVSGIKRGLLYKVLERLEKQGLLVTRKEEGVMQFIPEPPDVLLQCLQTQEDELKHSKKELESVLPELKAKFNLSTERPVLRFFEGVEGLRAMYEDKLESGSTELYFVRSARAQVYRDAFGKWFTHYLQRQAKAHIKVHALTVDDEEANHDPAVDAARNVVRTWLRPEDYTAPIEIDAYGNRLAILSYGKEIFGVIIESEPIAKAMSDLFVLADRGAKTLTIIHDHPAPRSYHKDLKELDGQNESISSSSPKYRSSRRRVGVA